MEIIGGNRQVVHTFHIIIEYIFYNKYSNYDYLSLGKKVSVTIMPLRYKRVKALDVRDRYECSVMLRINTWLKTLGIKYELEPELSGCMMHTDGKCFLEYSFFFDK
jgi:hypothetical protein